MYFYFYVTVSPHEIGVEVQDHRLHSATKIDEHEKKSFLTFFRFHSLSLPFAFSPIHVCLRLGLELAFGVGLRSCLEQELEDISFSSSMDVIVIAIGEIWMLLLLLLMGFARICAVSTKVLVKIIRSCLKNLNAFYFSSHKPCQKCVIVVVIILY